VELPGFPFRLLRPGLASWNDGLGQNRRGIAGFLGRDSYPPRSEEAARTRKSFGFGEMDSDEQAETAIDALNGQEVNGRALTVNAVLPREERDGSRQQPPPAP
jgi:hypothetical protein